MAVSTTQSIWRSGGGDTTRTAYCGSGVMVASFYIPSTNASGDSVQASSTNASTVILPTNAVVLSVAVIGGAGAAETFDLGYANAQGTTQNGILNGVAADANATFQTGSSGATGIGQTGVFTSLSTITGGGTLTGDVSGWITYFVVDPLAGQQNV